MRFPPELIAQSPEELAVQAAGVRPELEALLAREGIAPAAYLDSLESGLLPLAGWLARRRPRKEGPLILGVAGAQGSGKSTLAAVLQLLLHRSCELRCARLSIDDLYLTRAERTELARTVHPLLLTRGVPGTHDVGLGLAVLRALASTHAARVVLPRFDKASDDRAGRSQWAEVVTPLDCVIFEGWCVGARAVPEHELEPPLNALERDEDRDGTWRRHVNAQLGGAYRGLFDWIDVLLFLEVPDLACSKAWRTEQERKLRARVGADGAAMSDAALDRFVQHYERVSRQMLVDVPERADFVLDLSHEHEFTEMRAP